MKKSITIALLFISAFAWGQNPQKPQGPKSNTIYIDTARLSPTYRMRFGWDGVNWYPIPDSTYIRRYAGAGDTLSVDSSFKFTGTITNHILHLNPKDTTGVDSVLAFKKGRLYKILEGGGSGTNLGNSDLTQSDLTRTFTVGTGTLVFTSKSGSDSTAVSVESDGFGAESKDLSTQLDGFISTFAGASTMESSDTLSSSDFFAQSTGTGSITTVQVVDKTTSGSKQIKLESPFSGHAHGIEIVDNIDSIGFKLQDTSTYANGLTDSLSLPPLYIVKRLIAAGGGGTTIYTGDGSLTGDRTVSLNGHSLTFGGTDGSGNPYGLVATPNIGLFYFDPTGNNGSLIGIENISGAITSVFGVQDSGGTNFTGFLTQIGVAGNKVYDQRSGIGIKADSLSVDTSKMSGWVYPTMNKVVGYVAAHGGGSGAVSSVFGRTGAVVAASNDYTFAQIGSKPTTLSGYGITDAQSTLVSGTNIKTVNSTTLLGSGNLAITTANTDTTSTGFATQKSLIPYLTKAQVVAAYQPIGTYLTPTGTQPVSNKTFLPANIHQTPIGTVATDSIAVKLGSTGKFGAISTSGIQKTITLTTTGSGAATLVANTLNIPTPATGFTNPMTTLGDIIYEDATPTAVRLAGNTTTTQKFLTQTGNGTISAAPSYFDLFGTANTFGLNNTFTTSVTTPKLIGGTGTTSTITIQPTSGVGTTGELILFKNGNNGASLVGEINHLGMWSIGPFASFNANLDVTTGNAVAAYIQNTSNSTTLQITAQQGSFTGDMIKGYTATAAGSGFNLLTLWTSNLTNKQFGVNGNGQIFSNSLTASQPVVTDASKNMISQPYGTLPQTSQTTTYAIGTNDFYVDCNGTFTTTLPTAVGVSGKTYVVTNTGVGVITIATTSSQLINGASTQTLTANQSMTLHSNATGWIIN